ncbi:DUF4192 domain-containing protein [Nocardioides antri]|uniref:DUF4192 domain-containing protein n=1 Tax=Nocardioides antri TaxID=2607659 RepID=A0A5B1M727_9ACTN|nr:DUF4192 domain-containing protein [Nocardioides antri]KAA1429065.1 DUF4192 domain-containing protein [Nocardioides antri]
MTSMPAAVPDPTPTFRVRSPDDLIALAPVVIGFHPADSVVMLASDGERPFHARLDLPPRSAGRDVAGEVAEMLLAPARRHRVRGLAFVFFSEDEVTVRRVWSALRHGTDRAGIHVQDALRVDGRRYYPLLAGARLREVGVAYDVSAHPFQAEAVLHGLVVERDREALVASVVPDETAQQGVEAALSGAGLVDRDPPATGADRRRWGEWVRGLVARHVASRSRLSDDDVARLAWAVQDLRVRDAAWELISRPGARPHQELWLDVARRVPDRLVAAPAALLGWSAWQAGNGALAWIAVDRCREVEPAYGLAAILARCLEQALAPDSVTCPAAWDEGLPA